MTECMVVLVTAPSMDAGRSIAQTVLEEHLAACVSLQSEVESHYWWEGKLESARETMLVIKTSQDQYPALEERIRCLHEYSVPEILALPVTAGNPAYLAWVAQETRPRQ